MNTNHSDKPLDWVTRFTPLIPKDGKVLDLACGSGRHANYLAGLGYVVTALDRDLGAMTKHDTTDNLELIEADLEDGRPWPLETRRFKAIVVTNYLYRPLFPTIIEALDEDGILIYETFSLGNEKYGRPSNPNFLLTPGELLSVCSERLRVVAYEEGLIKNPTPAIKQRICAISRLPDAEPASI